MRQILSIRSPPTPVHVRQKPSGTDQQRCRHMTKTPKGLPTYLAFAVRTEAFVSEKMKNQNSATCVGLGYLSCEVGTG